MGRVLFLFTNTFPFGKGETFIDNEMSFWKVFDKVKIVTLDVKLPLRIKDLPENTEIVLIQKMEGKETVKNGLKAILRKEIYSEISSLRLRYKLSVRRFKHLIGFTARGLYLASNIKPLIDKEMESGNMVFLYSYWLNQWSYACAILSQEIEIPAISRAHRYDLYSERNELNYLPLRKYIIGNLNGVYPISENGTEYLRSRYNNENIKLYRLGTKDMGTSPDPIDEPCFRIVSCSWVSKVKRLDRIIDALRLVKNKEVEWIHIGDGDLLEDIMRMAESLGTNIKVIFKGAMSQNEIFEFYKDTPIHYFINVSESEGIPVSIMEATSMGIPVIATNVGGVSEIVYDKTNGFLLNKEYNPEDLAEILLKETYPCQLRKNARLIWNEKFSADKNYTMFFSNLLFQDRTK